MTNIVLVDTFYKGPVTYCQYLNDDYVLIGNGPYLSLIDSVSLEEITRFQALKYRVIHKIVKSAHDPRLICVFGQKSFNLIRLNEKLEFENVLESLVEMEDWIFEINWQKINETIYLIIVCAHNQCIIFNLNTKMIERVIYCSQRCMLYSAKIIDFNDDESSDLESRLANLLIASGTIYNEILLWSASNGAIQSTLSGHDGVIFSIDFSSHNNLLFSSSDDRSVNVWQLELNDRPRQVNSSQLYTRFYGHEARVWRCVSFLHAQKHYLCSIGEDLNCCVWDLDSRHLVYRFKAMRKASKNIWSLCVNEARVEIITGWADGGLQKFELKNYLNTPQEKCIEKINESSEDQKDQIEWSLKSENEKDFIRTLLLMGERIICCTNLGSLYSINTDAQKKDSNQKLLFKSVLLSNFNVMTKVKLSHEENTWLLAIGTLKGFIYLLRIKLADDFNKDLITIDCLNCVSVEEELESPECGRRALISPGSTKIFNLLWHEYKPGNNAKSRYFLIACYSFLNGLMHLYELDSSTNQINLAARLFLPQCKHRWLTSYSIAAIKTLHNNDDDSIKNEANEENVERRKEMIYLTVGDKSGSLHLYEIERFVNVALGEDEEESLEEMSKRLGLIKPRQSMKNFTKENDAVSAIYSKKISEHGENYLIICCCKDGYYRVLELNLESRGEDEEEEEEEEMEHEEVSEVKNPKPEPTSTNNDSYPNINNIATTATTTTTTATKPLKELLKLINKYQINSYIDLIESFLFDDYFKFNHHLPSAASFDLEKDVKLALCFYGDKFVLWNFQLSRAVFEFRCGGANRSWDFEFLDSPNAESLLFRFVYIKNKTIGEISKLISKNEIRANPLLSQSLRNHFSQRFHGNMITVCKCLRNYLLTGGEDTQLILTRINTQSNNNNNKNNLYHQYHLEGHDSVVKCVAHFSLSSNETLLVSAGGKANIKIWKFIFNEKEDGEELSIKKVIRLYEFKRFRPRKNDSAGKKEKPWLYIDFKSNPDVRFMDVAVESINNNLFKIYFACSDGFVRIFEYNLDTNKLDLIDKYSHPKCLFCIRLVGARLFCFGTDGYFLLCKPNEKRAESDEEVNALEKVKVLHQSGINGVDLFQEESTSLLKVATVGDDTRISLMEIDLSNEICEESCTVFKRELCHASAIVGVKFLCKEKIATIAKDQRLIIWDLDYDKKTINPIRTLFVDVADVSSMDVSKIDERNFRVSIVGVGIEIFNIKLE